MTDTLNWIYTKDHRPTFGECKGKTVIFHRNTWDKNEMSMVDANSMDFDHWAYVFLDDGVNAHTDRHCFVSITDPDPEPVPCKLCGGIPKVAESIRTESAYNVSCQRADHTIYFNAPTRAEAIQLWNKWNGE